jgi:sulfate permease, SulP family
MATTHPNTPPHPTDRIAQVIPFVSWMRGYDREQFIGDLIAGMIVAVMLIPQSMAYALLAGLPPQVGLYASIAPLMVYGLLGSSRVLAVGPTALVSLLVMAGVSQFAEPGTPEFIGLVLTLTLMSAVLQVVMGVARIGFLVNFLSHPVLSGFTSAAAVIIGMSQLKHLTGIDIPRLEHVYQTLGYAVQHAGQLDPVTMLFGGASVALLFYAKGVLGDQLRRRGVPENIRVPLTKLGPLVVVLLGTVIVWITRADVAIVGEVPAGLPGLTLPDTTPATLGLLLPTALTISLMGYMESISIAKSLASKRREKIDPNQELIALGAANFASVFTGGYPITGGLSRSVVNFSAGARTGLASIITAGLIVLTVLFLTPLFYYLPQAALAAIIVVAVASLFDLKTLRHTWRTSRPDAAALIVTFVAVLVLGIERGILLGVGTAIFLHLWASSRPPIKELGRLLGTEQYYDIQRYDVETQPDVYVMRVDGSLYFPNAHYVEEHILEIIATRPQINSVVLVCSAMNTIDASAIHVLTALLDELSSAGIRLHLAEVKPQAMQRLVRSGVLGQLGESNVHKSTFEAYLAAKVPA